MHTFKVTIAQKSMVLISVARACIIYTVFGLNNSNRLFTNYFLRLIIRARRRNLFISGRANFHTVASWQAEQSPKC